MLIVYGELERKEERSS